MKELIKKAADFEEGFEYLAKGEAIPPKETAPRRETFSEILNKVGKLDEPEDVLAKLCPLVVCCLILIAGVATYYAFIYPYKLP